jgi:hypothetical protein
VHIQRTTLICRLVLRRAREVTALRRRVIGAALTILGVLALLFAPVGGVSAVRTLEYAVSKVHPTGGV